MFMKEEPSPVGQVAGAAGHVLTTIAFSHYVEKARWALERFGVPYVDHRYLPILHFAGVWAATRGRGGRADQVSTAYSTPVLKTPDGQMFYDSADIVRYASRRFAPPSHDLYPDPEAAELEHRLGVQLGPHTRRAVYDAVFADPGLLRDVGRRNVGAAQAALFSVTLPVVVAVLRRGLAVNDQQVARSVESLRREMDAMSKRLADGRPYLLGDRFTAADLTLACMAAPVVAPGEYSAWIPSIDRLPEASQQLIREQRETPAGRHALRMFQEERRRVVGG